MNKYTYIVGATAVVLAMSGLPAVVAYAEDSTANVETKTETAAAVAPTATGTALPVRVSDDAREAEMKRAQLEAVAAKKALIASTTAQMRTAVQNKVEETRKLMQTTRAELASSTDGGPLSEQQRRELKLKAEAVREELKQDVEQVREEAKQQFEQARETFKDRIEFMRENATTSARSLEQLKQMIENRRMEVRDEAASTTPEVRKLLEGVAPMRIAVHALLASRDLLEGGIGQRVSDIARQVDDSAATTTNAEAKIQSRGFFSKLFFGGDKKSAEEISKQVAQNQERIQKLTGLLSEASTTADVKAALETHIQAIQDQQGRLQDVAQSESKLWGLFSWRFF